MSLFWWHCDKILFDQSIVTIFIIYHVLSCSMYAASLVCNTLCGFLQNNRVWSQSRRLRARHSTQSLLSDWQLGTEFNRADTPNWLIHPIYKAVIHQYRSYLFMYSNAHWSKQASKQSNNSLPEYVLQWRDAPHGCDSLLSTDLTQFLRILKWMLHLFLGLLIACQQPVVFVVRQATIYGRQVIADLRVHSTDFCW
jgi:hypothetical protein